MENKLARFFRATGKLRFFLPLGLILLVMGGIMLSMTPKQYGETTGIITGVQEYQERDADGVLHTRYEAAFTYLANGRHYENSFSDLAEKPNVGDQIPVYYDPDNPQSVSNSKNTGLIAVVMLVAGAAAVVFAVLSGVKGFRKNRELDEKLRGSAGAAEAPVVTPVPREQLTEYYVSFDGNSLRPGYIVEDRARSVVYTAEMTKNAVIGNRTFAFTDRQGRTVEHQVGHTVTESFSNEFFSTTSFFKFDGVNIWDVLHDRGVRIATDFHSALPKVIYTVSQNGRFFATIETSGKYVHEEDAAEHKLNVPVGRYYFRCWTDSQDLELLFLTVFAISETEQAIVE